MGIDLGTSRSSIVAADGTRKTVESYVGWPKDPISRKHVGRDVVFGRMALDHRLSVDLYRPLEHGVIKHTGEGEDDGDTYRKNLEAAQALIHHIVSLAEPGRDEELYAVIGAPAQASVRNKQAILEAAQGVLDSVLIVSEPFSVAYGMERISDVLVIDIGAGTTDLCRMHGTVPGDDDQISFPIAGDAIDQKLYELVRKRHPDAQISLHMCTQIKEQYGFVSSAQDAIEVMLPVNGKPTKHDLTTEVKEACEIIIEPVLDSVHKLIASFDPAFQDKLRNNIILAGGGALIDGLNKRIEDGLDRVGGGQVTVVDEPVYSGANGALQLARDMPAEYWQQVQ
ncbi:MAG: MamK family actin-like protein [Phycisphaeraceae bacterium]